MVERRKQQSTPAVRSFLHSFTVVVPPATPAGVQLVVPIQMHASYLIVHAPTLGGDQAVTWIDELLMAAAVMPVDVAGSNENMKQM